MFRQCVELSLVTFTSLPLRSTLRITTPFRETERLLICSLPTAAHASSQVHSLPHYPPNCSNLTIWDTPSNTAFIIRFWKPRGSRLEWHRLLKCSPLSIIARYSGDRLICLAIESESHPKLYFVSCFHDFLVLSSRQHPRPLLNQYRSRRTLYTLHSNDLTGTALLSFMLPLHKA